MRGNIKITFPVTNEVYFISNYPSYWTKGILKPYKLTRENILTKYFLNTCGNWGCKCSIDQGKSNNLDTILLHDPKNEKLIFDKVYITNICDVMQ